MRFHLSACVTLTAFLAILAGSQIVLQSQGSHLADVVAPVYAQLGQSSGVFEPVVTIPAPVRVQPSRPVAMLASRVSAPITQIVPLKNSKNALMVEATLVNAQTGKRVSGTFIIDTGATYTSISRDLARQLGVSSQPGDSITITTANGKIQVPKVSIDRLMVNGVEAEDIQATVIDVQANSHFSGLLGLSFIRKFKMTIDPTANQLVFEPTGL